MHFSTILFVAFQAKAEASEDDDALEKWWHTHNIFPKLICKYVVGNWNPNSEMTCPIGFGNMHLDMVNWQCCLELVNQWATFCCCFCFMQRKSIAMHKRGKWILPTTIFQHVNVKVTNYDEIFILTIKFYCMKNKWIQLFDWCMWCNIDIF